MLADKAVELGFVVSIFPNTIHQLLKNKNKNEGPLLSSSTLLVGLERGWGDFVPGASIDPIDNADE